MSKRCARIQVSALAAAGVMLSAATLPYPAAAQEGSSAAAPSAPTADNAGRPAEWALLEQRCEKCHNSVDWAGSLAFDTLFPQDIASDAETWEKAIRKLRGRQMPPPGKPQPDQATIRGELAGVKGNCEPGGARRCARISHE